MRRITALLLMLLLLPGLVAAEDDFDLDDILSDADPDVVKNTYSQPGNADDILLDENNEPRLHLRGGRLDSHHADRNGGLHRRRRQPKVHQHLDE